MRASQWWILITTLSSGSSQLRCTYNKSILRKRRIRFKISFRYKILIAFHTWLIREKRQSLWDTIVSFQLPSTNLINQIQSFKCFLKTEHGLSKYKHLMLTFSPKWCLISSIIPSCCSYSYSALISTIWSSPFDLLFIKSESARKAVQLTFWQSCSKRDYYTLTRNCLNIVTKS